MKNSQNSEKVNGSDRTAIRFCGIFARADSESGSEPTLSVCATCNCGVFSDLACRDLEFHQNRSLRGSDFAVFEASARCAERTIYIHPAVDHKDDETALEPAGRWSVRRSLSRSLRRRRSELTEY
jgi:hypothetical protein